MKRLIANLSPLLLALLFAPGAFAIDVKTTTVDSFPCDVVFHAGDGEDLALDGDRHRVLNYKGRTFVPLRAFAELMGADVRFAEAGADGFNLIDVTAAGNAPAVTPEKEDAEGYVSLYDLKYDTETSDTGEVLLRFGMLRVNKDLEGREISLWGGNEPNETETMYEWPVILNEAIEPLRAGDTRPLSVRGRAP
ncbi:MAG: copper amine oxidase N-terminal domain-containing protein [Clostridiales Family XIII bacterium]|jgi:hypothetical protein|nr:copper amine oxidase N-terminal domain-containing protein [Clostridiales Family XIII bacterium]